MVNLKIIENEYIMSNLLVKRICYSHHEKCISNISYNYLKKRYIYTIITLKHTNLPIDLIPTILEQSFRPSEIYGRRKFYYDLIFHPYIIKRLDFLK